MVTDIDSEAETEILEQQLKILNKAIHGLFHKNRG